MPEDAKDAIGVALGQVQVGKRHASIKPLIGLPGASEIAATIDTDTYRLVYVVNLPDAIYVLHAFKKKSKSGPATLKKVWTSSACDCDRLRRHQMNRTDDCTIVESSGNVFADLGLHNPQERQLKARLASKIYDEIEARGWTQAEAAETLGLSQPDVSRLTRGLLKGFSIDRLMALLVTLDYRVSIHIEGKNRPAEDIRVAGNH